MAPTTSDSEVFIAVSVLPLNYSFDSLEKPYRLTEKPYPVLLPPPPPLGSFHQLEDHPKAHLSRSRPFRYFSPGSDGGQRKLYGVGRPKVPPMLGREVVVAKQGLCVFIYILKLLGPLRTELL